jgi:hypothetical protein
MDTLTPIWRNIPIASYLLMTLFTMSAPSGPPGNEEEERMKESELTPPLADPRLVMKNVDRNMTARTIHFYMKESLDSASACAINVTLDGSRMI